MKDNHKSVVDHLISLRDRTGRNIDLHILSHLLKCGFVVYPGSEPRFGCFTCSLTFKGMWHIWINGKKDLTSL